MAKKKPKGKKKSSNKSVPLTKLLIIQAVLQIIKLIIDIVNSQSD